ncbi:hypothetical protein M0R45_002265 [Rubus argutus]|uniref:Uncharacterized protein n=1 Tax=Rubus argutus TaxID=59490 RepID=A0AAW1VCF2_RUBAR
MPRPFRNHRSSPKITTASLPCAAVHSCNHLWPPPFFFTCNSQFAINQIHSALTVHKPSHHAIDSQAFPVILAASFSLLCRHRFCHHLTSAAFPCRRAKSLFQFSRKHRRRLQNLHRPIRLLSPEIHVAPAPSSRAVDLFSVPSPVLPVSATRQIRPHLTS